MSREEDETSVIPLIEETVRIEKEDLVTGRVRVRTVTESFEHVVGQDLVSENVEITRVRIDREVAEVPAVRQEGDVTIVSLVEEEIVVTKRLVVTEEIHIRRVISAEKVETTISLRKQHAVVEREDNDGNTTTTPTIGER